MRQYLTAVVLILLGSLASGCGDSATVNPVVELASLTVSPGTLQPAFTGGTTEYNVNLTSNVTSVTITAQPAVAGDTVAINGQTTTSSVVPLGAAGTTTPVSIVVSESNTNSRTYTVLLVRAGLNGNNSLQSLTVSPGTLAPAFSANTQDYTVDVANNVETVTVTPTLQDPAAKMTVNGKSATSGQPGIVSLNPPGQSTLITIVVTAQNDNAKTYSVRVSRGVSGNNNLQNLTVSPGTLSPDFSPSTIGYTVNLPATLLSNVNNVRVTPTLQDATASMTVNGQPTTSGQVQPTPLPGPGSNAFINIVVTAQNGTSKIYSVNVIRAALNGNNSLQSLTVSPGTLAPAFNANRQDYTVDVANNVGIVTVTPTLSDPAATMMVNGQSANSGQARTIQLNRPGLDTAINIVVTAQNHSTKTYSVTVSRGVSGNNNLQNLAVSPGTLSPDFSSGTVGYRVNLPATLPNNVTNMSVTPTLQDATASMTVNGQPATSGQAQATPLPGSGLSTFINIVVTAQNGTQKTYSVNVIRAALGANDNLQGLTVSPGTLTPAFNANTQDYTVAVASNVGSVTVTPTLSDPAATMTVNGQATNSGQGRPVPLNGPGSTTVISIVVTAQNGSRNPYVVAVTRAQSSDNNLAALTVTPGTLAPAFAEGTLAYAVDVATDVPQVTISATKSDPNAVLSGSITDPGVGQATGQATIHLGAPGTSTPVTITVTAPNGISKTYGLTVNRAAPSSDNNLAALTVTGGPLVPDFAPSTTAYTVNVPAAVASVTVSATKSDPGAVMSGDVTAGTGVATGQATFDQLVPLTPRIVSITVIAANGVPKPYSITITRALF